MKNLSNCLNFSRKTLYLAILSLSASLVASQAQAVNHVISNPGPEVYSKIHEVGFFDTSGLVTTANGLHRGNRLAAVLDGYAYMSESTNTCGGIEAFGATGPLGTLIVDVHNPANPTLVGNITNSPGLNSFNLAAFKLVNGQHILVIMTSNACAVPQPFLPQRVAEGLDVYNVDDPSHPVFLAHVAIPEINSALRAQISATDSSADHLNVNFGRSVVQKNGKTYLTFSVGTDTFTPALGAAQIWDFTNPSAPQRVSYWGPEMVQVASLGLPISLAALPGVVNPNLQVLTDYDMAFNPPVLGNNFDNNLTRNPSSMYLSQNGQRALVPMYEGGLALLDTKDLTNPKLISVALNTSPEIFDLSKSVYSGAVAATANGKTVVELDRDSSDYFLSVSLNGGPPLKPVIEGGLTLPIATLPGATFSGNTEYVGTACSSVIPPASGVTVAVAARGTCTFATKMENIRLAGYSYFVMINNASAGNLAIGMAGTPISVAIPGVGTSFSAGTSIFGGNTLPAIGTLGLPFSASVIKTNWGYVRIWDYSDEKNPVLASTFQTLCSSDASLAGTPSCPKVGTTGGGFDTVTVTVQGQKAFVGWAQDGLVVIDIKDPYNPREIARFGNNQASHGLGRFAGSYLVNEGSNKNDPLIYGIDADKGLYILKMDN